MKYFIQSQRNGDTTYSIYEGMELETVVQLMTELGHTNLIEISEEDFNTATIPA